MRTSRNVYVSNTTHTTHPNVKNILRALHQVSATNVRFRLRVICLRSFMGVGGARDEEHESESEEHVISLRFRLTPTTVQPVNASSSFRFRIFLQPPPPPPPPPTADENRLLTSLLIGRRHDDDVSVFECYVNEGRRRLGRCGWMCDEYSTRVQVCAKRVVWRLDCRIRFIYIYIDYKSRFGSTLCFV